MISSDNATTHNKHTVAEVTDIISAVLTCSVAVILSHEADRNVLFRSTQARTGDGMPQNGGTEVAVTGCFEL